MRHWSTLHGAHPDPHRIYLAKRADGVVLAVELDDGAPVFIALLPDEPVRRRVLLEGADSHDSGKAQIEERYPPSPWMLEADHGELDLDPVGEGFRLPFTHSVAGAAKCPVFVNEDMKGSFCVTGYTEPKSYMRLRLAALELTIAGEGHVVVDQLIVNGGIALQADPWTVLAVGDRDDEPKTYMLRALREYPEIERSGSGCANLEIRGRSRVTLALIVHRVSDSTTGAGFY